MSKRIKQSDYDDERVGMVFSFWVGLFLAIGVVAFVVRLESQIKIIE